MTKRGNISEEGRHPCIPCARAPQPLSRGPFVSPMAPKTIVIVPRTLVVPILFDP